MSNQNKPKFEGLIFTYYSNERKVQHTLEGLDNALPEVLVEFANFLQGVGYSLPRLDYPIIINDETEET